MNINYILFRSTLFTLACLVSQVKAETIELISNINTGASPSHSSSPINRKAYNNKLYFSADNGINGRELHVYDSISGETNLVTDLNQGQNDSNPLNLIVYNDKLYFTADDGVHGQELFVFNSTTNTTRLVSDIYKGENSSLPSHLAVYNNKLYFNADDGIHGKELYEFDDVTNQANLASDIYSGDLSSDPQNLIVYNKKLYFSADNGIHGREIFAYDNVTFKSSLVDDFVNNNLSHISDFIEYDDKLFFTAEGNNSTYGIYIYNSETNKTSLLSSDYVGDGVENIVVYNDKLYFIGSSSMFNYNLHVYDLATNQLSFISSLNDPSSLVLYNDKFYFFQAYNYYAVTPLDFHLYEFDPATHNINKISDSANPLDYLEKELTVFNNKLYFTWSEGYGRELYSYSSYTNDITLAADLYVVEAGSEPTNMVSYNGNLYFFANDGIHGRELFVYNKESKQASLVADVFSGFSSSYCDNTYVPNYKNDLIIYDHKLYFPADNGESGCELYVYDSVTNAVRLVFNFKSNTNSSVSLGDRYYSHYASSYPRGLTVYNDNLYFNVTTDASSPQPSIHFQNIGTGIGYVYNSKTENIELARESRDVGNDLTIFDNKLFFVFYHEDYGRELFSYDSTTDITTLVADIHSGRNSSNVEIKLATNKKLYFTADDGVHGSELYFYDIDTNEVNLLSDFMGYGDWLFSELVLYMNKVYFFAEHADLGRELFVYDPITDELKLAADINVGENSSISSWYRYDYPNLLTIYKDKLYFTADDGIHGSELYVYDITTSEASLVLDINVGELSSDPSIITVYNNKLYFNATGSQGRKLYVYDNETDEVNLVINATTGVAMSSIISYKIIDNKVYFSANDGRIGTELYSLHTNHQPIGNVIIEGSAAEGTTLSVNTNIMDPDGLGIISYQWYRDGEVIKGAINNTHSLPRGDIDHSINVAISYTDAEGTLEKVLSNNVLILSDFDGDGIPDVDDLDDDNDGVNDENDEFPLDASESVDTDGDGIGNNADTDDDGDGVDDNSDAFPLDASESVDTDGDGIGNNTDTDDDGDGVDDNSDAFPLDASESVDTDGDGVGNNADTDDDGDGVDDNSDVFPLDSSRASVKAQESSGGGSLYILVLLLILIIFRKFDFKLNSKQLVTIQPYHQ